MTLRYSATPAPAEYDPEYLERELRNIADALAAALDLDVSFQVGRPREGMVRYYNTATYNPGSGTGLYVYTGGAWLKV